MIKLGLTMIELIVYDMNLQLNYILWYKIMIIMETMCSNKVKIT